MGWVVPGPQRLLCVPKIGRKLLLGKKSTPMVINMSQEKGQQKNKSKIWGFRHHIQGVLWDFLLPSSTLAFQVVIIFFYIRNFGIWSREVRPKIFKMFNSDKNSHGTPCI